VGQTEIKNDLPFEVGVLHLAGRDGVPVAVAVIKATYSIQSAGLVLAEMQQRIFYAGEPYGEPGKSSYRHEPECAYFKPCTDVILVAAAISPRRAATHVEVDFSVGHLRKAALVFGDRFWYRGFTDPHLVGPEPFHEIPLIYERSFGGWDRSHPDANRHTFDRRNPLGRGFQTKFASDEDLLPLPNVESPDDLITDMRSRPSPVGFGFISPDWQPRAALAGTYDEAWTANQMPALPLDFDFRFFNAASPGLVANGYLTGNELVSVTNCSERGVLSFTLPSVPPPCCWFRLARQSRLTLQSRLDTLVVNTVDGIVTLTWRCHVPVPCGPEQLLRLRVLRGQ